MTLRLVLDHRIGIIDLTHSQVTYEAWDSASRLRIWSEAHSKMFGS